MQTQSDTKILKLLRQRGDLLEEMDEDGRYQSMVEPFDSALAGGFLDGPFSEETPTGKLQAWFEARHPKYPGIVGEYWALLGADGRGEGLFNPGRSGFALLEYRQAFGYCHGCRRAVSRDGRGHEKRCKDSRPLLMPLVRPIRKDILLVRQPCEDGAFRAHVEPETNVPWSVVNHSPTGLNWGYAGSGPADLALNILNAWVPPGADELPAVQEYISLASGTASAYHQEFKMDFLVNMPAEGGTIPKSTIEAWLHNKRLERPLR